MLFEENPFERQRWEDVRLHFAGLFAGKSTWPRFTKYEIEERPGKGYIGKSVIGLGKRRIRYTPRDIFIRPHKDSIFRDWYKPFDFAPIILRDFFDLIHSLYETPKSDFWDGKLKLSDREIVELHLENERRKASKLIPFYDKWGSLGISWDKKTLVSKYSKNMSKVVTSKMERHIFAQTLTRLSFADLVTFFSDPMETTSREMGFRTIIISKQIPQIYKMTEEYLRTCGENVRELHRYLYWFANKTRLWRDFQDGNFAPNDEYCNGHTWKEYLSGSYVDGVGVQLTFDGSWKLDYEFSSLLTALALMLTLNQISDKQQVRFCADCKHAFIAQNPARIYCSDSCNLRARVRRCREKKKATSKTVVKNAGVKPGVELSRKAGKSQGKSRQVIKRQNPRQ
jgi:hypothetical protein